MDQERDKTEWEERIRFVARYYRERTFDPEIGWKQFADKQNTVSYIHLTLPTNREV